MAVQIAFALPLLVGASLLIHSSIELGRVNLGFDPKGVATLSFEVRGNKHESDKVIADYYARLWVGTRSYLLRESLATLEVRVSAHGFVRAHRSALVRTSAVRELRPNADGELFALLGSGVRIPVSRRRRASFLAAVRAQGA